MTERTKGMPDQSGLPFRLICFTHVSFSAETHNRNGSRTIALGRPMLLLAHTHTSPHRE
jgi:hypothetical protein